MDTLDYITLTPQETAKLLSAGSGDAALVYLYMKATGDTRLMHAQERLSMQAQTLGWAESLLKQLGLMDTAAESPRYDKASAPAYTGEAVAAFAAQDSSFSLLQGEVSRRLGRPLTSEELKTLLAIRDYLKLPPEVVNMAVTFCMQKNEYYNRTHGKDRTITMHAIEQESYRWANKGITTLERASDYIGKRLKAMSPEGQVKRMLHLDRPLVESERTYIHTWLDWGFDPDAIAAAYEKTVLNKGALNWPYMNGILQNWHEKGLHRVEQVQNADKKAPASQQDSTFTPGESEMQAIAAMKRNRKVKWEE